MIIHNRYAVAEKIGEGGMGNVYRVRDTLQNNIDFALKAVKRSVFSKGDPDVLLRFKKEFDIMTRLKHPNLVRVHDFLTDIEENSYIVMEYVPGITLGKLLKRENTIARGQAVEIIVHMLRALGFIHSRNIIYRDIKPDNIIISISGKTAKLSDFGISDIGCAESERIKGTLLYMAPEVLEGDITPQIDIFSLGIVLLQMTTGKPFYKGENYNMSTIVDILKDSSHYESIRNREFAEVADKGLRHIIEKMTAFDRHERYQSCAEAIMAINKHLSMDYEIETKATKESYVLGAPFINRRSEYKELIRPLEADSVFCIKMLRGSQGSGKSRLLSELKKHCQLNNVLFVDACCPKQGERPFGVFLPLLKRIFLHIDRKSILKYAPYLKRIMPKEKIFDQISLPGVQDFEKEMTAVCDSIVRIIFDFVSSLQKQAVIAIDDISYADSWSIKVLCALIREVRTDEISNIPVKAFYFTISDEAGMEDISPECDINAEEIALKPFTEKDVTEYIECIFGENNLDESLISEIDSIREQAGGNPYFLEEYIKTLVQSDIIQRKSRMWSIQKIDRKFHGLDHLKAIIEQRIENTGFNKEQKEAVSMISLIGKELSLENISSLLSNFSTEFMNSFVRELERLEFLTVLRSADEIKYRVSNNLIRQAFLKDTKDLRSRHAYLAERFENVFDDSLEDFYEEIAYHFSEAGNSGKAVFYLELAGYKASRNYHYSDSVKYYDKAISLENPYTKNYYNLILKKTETMAQNNQWKESFAILRSVEGKITDTEQLGQMYYNLSLDYFLTADYPRAADAADKSLKYRVLAFGPLDKKVIESITQTASAYYYRGEYNSALAEFRRALDLQIRVSGEADVSAAELYNDIGVIFWCKGDYDNALENIKKSLDLKIKLLGVTSPDVSVGYNNLGLIYSKMNKYEKALVYYEKSMEIAVSLFGRKHLSVSTELHNIGMIYEKMADYDQAIKLYKESISIRKRYYHENHPDIANSYHNIGGIYVRTNRNEKGLYYITKAMNIWLKFYGEEHPNIASSYNHLGYLYSNLGKYREAFDYHNKALSIRLKVFEEGHQDISGSYYNLADTCFKMKDFSRALYYYEKVMNYESNNKNRDEKYYININKNMGIIYKNLGDRANAEKHLKEALDISRSVYGKISSKTEEINDIIKELKRKDPAEG